MVYSNDSGSGRRIPANFSPVYSAKDIAGRVRELGQEVSAWCDGVWRDSHTDVLVIPVLRGGVFFFADLVRELSTSIEVAQYGLARIKQGQMQSSPRKWR